MKFDLTAGELVRIGRCDGKCLLALEDRCDCRCRGAFHGLLADIPIGSITPVGQKAEPAGTDTRQPRRPLDEVAVNRIIDLFAQGVPVRSIAQEARVSESTIRKQLKDFEATGSIPVVRADGGDR